MTRNVNTDVQKLKIDIYKRNGIVYFSTSTDDSAEDFSVKRFHEIKTINQKTDT